MKVKRRCAALCAAVLWSCLWLGGCGAERGAAAHKPGDEFLIGFSMATFNEERWYADRDEFMASAKAHGATVLIEVAYNNAETQYSQVKDMISKGIDVLVLIPYDATSASVIVTEAKNAGIKVISYDRLVLNADVDLYISFDNVKVGQLQAEEMLRAKPRGNYVVVNGPATDYNATMINQGVKSVLTPHIQSGDIVVSEFSATNWSADEASGGINAMLQDNKAVDAVIAANDNLAGGAINTLALYHRVPDVPVVGMDADLAACQRVAEGQQLMTIYKPIRLIAEAAADFAARMVYGEEIETNDAISDGKFFVPFYKIAPIPVKADNLLDTVIHDGFHSVNEVYMNVAKEKWPKD